MNLNLILSLINEIIQGIKTLFRLKEAKELKDATNDSLESRDQRKLEEVLGGSSGPVAPDKYPGLSVRERKTDTPKKEKE